MNESLMRDLHDTQIEELTAVKSAIAELAKKPTATPTDIAKVQMMISNIRIPEPNDTVIKEALGRIHYHNKKMEENADNQLKWLQSIHKYSESLNVKDSPDSKVMSEGIQELKQARKSIDTKVFEFRLSHYAVMLWAILATILTACCFHKQQSMHDQLAQIREDALKFRYIKMKGEANPKRIAEIEDVFVYNRNYDKIIEMQDDVKAFEDAVAKKTIADEQARLQKLESERLNNKANMLKQK